MIFTDPGAGTVVPSPNKGGVVEPLEHRNIWLALPEIAEMVPDQMAIVGVCDPHFSLNMSVLAVPSAPEITSKFIRTAEYVLLTTVLPTASKNMPSPLTCVVPLRCPVPPFAA
jgi:hypothetical protein